MADQLVQLITAVRMMGRSEGATVQQLTQELEVSQRTVFRLLRRVDDAGFPLYEDRDGHEKIWYMNWGDGRGLPMPNVNLNPEEHAVLGLLLGHVGAVPSLSTWAQSLQKKLQFLVAFGGSYLNLQRGPSLEFSQSDLAKISKPEDSKNTAILLAAISRHHTCMVTYKSPHNPTAKEYAIYPLCCFVASGGLYLYCVTQREGKEKLIMLAVERILALQEDESASFVPAQQYDVKSLLEDPFGIILEERWIQTDVVIDAKQGWYETQKQWPSRFVIYEEDPEGWRFHIHTRGAFSLMQWLLSCAGHVRSISDSELCASYQALLKSQLELLES